MLMMSLREEPSAAYAVAFSWCEPFANLVVSSAHCMPSETVLSVLSAALSRKNWTRLTLPEAFT